MQVKFPDHILRKAKVASNAVIINELLKDYFNETLEQANRYPKLFGDNKTLAEEDPKTLAKQYTKDYPSTFIKFKKSIFHIYCYI